MIARNRTQEYPAEPASLVNLHIVPPWTHTLGQQEEEFLFFDNGPQATHRIVAYATEDNLRRLAAADKWFMDGNFAMAPPKFLQLYVIHVSLGEVTIPLVYAFLENKTEATYHELFTAILNRCATYGVQPDPDVVMVDFELAVPRAVAALAAPLVDYFDKTYVHGHYRQGRLQVGGIRMREQECVSAIITQDATGQPPRKRVRHEYVRLQTRLRNLCRDYVNGLKGEIDDCSCKVENVDSFNNVKIYPLISSLLERDYFRYYKLNIFRPCPFGSNADGKCGSRSCAVDKCKDEHIPTGLKKNHSQNKYSREAQKQEKCDDENELGVIDAHISQESKDAFQTWKKYDDLVDNFCEPEDEHSQDAVYYDLVRNPERFTGYMGPSAVNVWQLIYDQNCFKPDSEDNSVYLPRKQELCLEKRVFYRMISGFHTSINVDVTANWLKPATSSWGQPSWGPNVEEFRKRFDPKLTWGEGPQRLKNLYFLYLVELRAMAKVAPFLEQEEFYTGNEQDDIDSCMEEFYTGNEQDDIDSCMEEFYTGNEQDDIDSCMEEFYTGNEQDDIDSCMEEFYTGNEQDDREVKKAINDLLNMCKSFPEHFDESQLFQEDKKQLEEFKLHFRNISRIMDCVGCDKCRMWGKIQIRGLGTALKILFSGDSMRPDSTITHQHKKGTLPFQLTRGEIVALLNSFGRLSKSIHELEVFRKLMA
ncbi:ERO1-like protein beta [Lamellibrachia satsuma]|nr:ERO1-like protein beta [Lamellibrachia satsuma]